MTAVVDGANLHGMLARQRRHCVRPQSAVSNVVLKLWLKTALLLGLAVLPGCRETTPTVRKFDVRGVVVEVRAGGGSAVIRHEAIPDYMPAMTMAFRAKYTNQLAGLQSGDEISFHLVVAGDESWIEAVTRIGHGSAPANPSSTAAPKTVTTNASSLLADLVADMVFTNELNQAVRWSAFKGQAIGFTFLFTRCPLPEYCPRLAKNFAAATRKLQAMPQAPTNWHLLALTIDPAFDTPSVLRTYAGMHGADSTRWNLLMTSKEDTIRFARLFGLNYEPAGGTIEHDFRTVIVDAAGKVQTVWPIGGDTTDALVTELIKAARVTNAPLATP